MGLPLLVLSDALGSGASNSVVDICMLETYESVLSASCVI
jgi:hypothetical protein